MNIILNDGPWNVISQPINYFYLIYVDFLIFAHNINYMESFVLAMFIMEGDGVGGKKP